MRAIPLSTAGTFEATVPFDRSLQGTVQTLRFRLDYLDDVDSDVLLDNIEFVAADADAEMLSAYFVGENAIRYTLSTSGLTEALQAGLFRSEDTIWDPGDEPLGTPQSVTPVGGQASRLFSLPSAFVPDLERPYTLLVADSGRTVNEADEENNVVPVTFLGLDRWYAASGDETMPVGWTVQIQEPGPYTLDIDVAGVNTWQLDSEAAVTVDDRPQGEHERNARDRGSRLARTRLPSFAG